MELGYLSIFDSANGTLMISRSFSGGAKAQNKIIRSIIMTSGINPTAFTMSNIFSAGSCVGNQVFSYDALIFNTAPKWA